MPAQMACSAARRVSPWYISALFPGRKVPTVNRPAPIPTRPDTLAASVQRLRVFGVIAAYMALVAVAWLSGNDLLSAACVVLLISAVMAPRLRRPDARWPWIAWTVLVGAVAVLTVLGHGRTALDLVPLAINLALGALFGFSLTDSHTPLIARAIIAIEGREHLGLPRVAGYARALTAAWTVLFLAQSILFVVVLGWWLPGTAADDPAHGWLVTWLHVGGFLLPALFMLVEYAFRRWYLRHVPHLAPQVFLQRLIRNWPQLLRDASGPAGHGVRDAG